MSRRSLYQKTGKRAMAAEPAALHPVEEQWRLLWQDFAVERSHRSQRHHAREAGDADPEESPEIPQAIDAAVPEHHSVVAQGRDAEAARGDEVRNVVDGHGAHQENAEEHLEGHEGGEHAPPVPDLLCVHPEVHARVKEEGSHGPRSLGVGDEVGHARPGGAAARPVGAAVREAGRRQQGQGPHIHDG
eukprot:CAMPEP_0197941006 /NCGR_PEP_ID=MMETSP1439-20131203/122149_1 /TAXON_ID=66791 /ORGANISM="Gonyaulax spinifera, Strain CCMP409" /LENGTH=187 /DNA_ID=CAMNT_0043564189 /DNA_START=120 /DNA_END=679 /DNA_ORIENTATION=+